MDTNILYGVNVHAPDAESAEPLSANDRAKRIFESQQYSHAAFHFTHDPKPKFALDGEGHILCMNEAASVLIANAKLRWGLSKKIIFGSRSFNARVAKVLSDMQAGRCVSKRLLRKNNNGDWVGYDFAVVKTAEPKQILLTVNEENYRANCSDNVFAETFQLTITESEVVSRVACAMSPKEIAHDMDISTNTVRAHLRSIYSKTGERSFSKLLCLILKLTQ